MVIKERDVPKDLMVLRFLYWREGLSKEDQRQYLKMEKGFEGELQFDEMLKERLPDGEWLILSDLLLERNSKLTQLDTILVSGNVIYNINVKNHEGDYYFKNGCWYMSPSGIEIHDPLLQLKRSETVLRQILRTLGLDIPIISKLVFVHHEFTLYYAPMNLPIVFPTQINRFFKALLSSTAKPGKKEWAFAKKLAALHLTESPYNNVPDYSYGPLRKGIYCNSCHSFTLEQAGKDLVCQTCDYTEKLPSALMRSVREFHILFPERRITVQAIKDWCQLDVDRRAIGRILRKNLKVVNKGGHSYYLL